MAAYVVVDIEVLEPVEYEEYKKRVAALGERRARSQTTMPKANVAPTEIRPTSAPARASPRSSEERESGEARSRDAWRSYV